MSNTNRGIDYGMGTTNIDTSTGIRYGVIHSNEVCQAWADSSEPQYGEPACPNCGGEVIDYDDEKHGDYLHFNRGYRSCSELACESCELHGETGDCLGEEPNGFTLEDEEYSAEQHGGDCDVFITKSPYFTVCEFCSPCAPGAGYILNTVSWADDPVKAYCFGHDWFDEGVAPYPVYSVKTGMPVNPDKE